MPLERWRRSAAGGGGEGRGLTCGHRGIRWLADDYCGYGVTVRVAAFDVTLPTPLVTMQV